MKESIETDFGDMEKKLRCYVNNGRIEGAAEVKEEPMVKVRLDSSLVKHLTKERAFDGSFMAVDCSTRTLKRANNWGVYLMRPACTAVKARKVAWSFKE